MSGFTNYTRFRELQGGFRTRPYENLNRFHQHKVIRRQKFNSRQFNFHVGRFVAIHINLHEGASIRGFSKKLTQPKAAT